MREPTTKLGALIKYVKPNYPPRGGGTTGGGPCPCLCGKKRDRLGPEPPLPRPLEPPWRPNGNLLGVWGIFLRIWGYIGQSRQDCRLISDYGKLTSRESKGS